MNNYEIKIKNIIEKNGEIDMMNYEIDIVFHKTMGWELPKYNYNRIAELGCIKLKNGSEIVGLVSNGAMIKQDGIGEEYDLVVMDYEDLSERVLSIILMYLYSILE